METICHSGYRSVELKSPSNRGFYQWLPVPEGSKYETRQGRVSLRPDLVERN